MKSKSSNSKGFLLLTIANIASKVLSLLYIPFLISNITQEGYGSYYAAYNIYAFVFILTISGSSAVIPKLMSQYIATNHEKDAIATFKIGRLMMLFMGVVMSLLLLISSKALVNFVSYPKAYFAIIALCPSILISSLNSCYRSYFQGRNIMKNLAISQFVEQLGNTIFSLLFSFILINYSLELGIAGGALGTAFGSALSLAYLYLQYKKHNKIPVSSKERSETNIGILKYMINYSIPLIVSTGLIYAGNNLIDVANIKRGLLQAGFSESLATIKYGDFGNYIQLMGVPLIIISALSITIFPLMSKTNALGNMLELKTHIKKVFKLAFLISIPASIGLSILSEEIFYLIFANKNSGGADIMKIGAFVLIFSSTCQLTNTILNSIGRVYKGTSSAMLGVVVKISANFIFIPMVSINIYGAVIGLFLTNVIPMTLNTFYIKKHLKTKDKILDSWSKPLISSLIMGLVVFATYSLFYGITSALIIDYIANAISILISIYIGILSYIQLLIRLKAVDEDELKLVPHIAKKLLFI